MKLNLARKCVVSTVAILFVTSLAMGADAGTTVQELAKTLSKVRSAELPAAAANLVVQSPTALKTTNAVTAVKAAIQVSPGATLSVVGAVCQVAPAAAPAIVTAAIELQPKLKGAILSAASDAAPAYRAEIAQAGAGSQTAGTTVTSGTGAGGGLRAAAVGIRITPLPPPTTPPTEVKTTDVEPYVGRRDYSRP